MPVRTLAEGRSITVTPPPADGTSAREARAAWSAREDPRPAAHDGRPADASPFARVLASVGDASAKSEHDVRRAIDAARGGTSMSAAELLSVQASVYRYGEVVDVASKLVDHAASGARTILQQQ